MFQSLFYWNLLSYCLRLIESSKSICFNPCFTGTSSHTSKCFTTRQRCLVSILVLLEPPLIPEMRHIERGFLMFQSLFYWNLLSYNRLASRYTISCESFNPCFTGTSSHTWSLTLRHFYLVSLFQSLFYWNLLSYKLRSVIITKSYISFNPCFTGTSSHTNFPAAFFGY